MSNIYIGKEVTHPDLGPGRIAEVFANNYVQVRFDSGPLVTCSLASLGEV